MIATEANGKANSVTPEPVKFSLTDTALTVNVTCKSCSHFNRIAHPLYKEVCAKKGVLEISKPCSRFSPDMRQVKFWEDKELVRFAAFLANVPDSKLSLIASILTQEHKTRKRGYLFGEMIYFLAFGGDYISNYRACRVIYAERDLVHVEGQNMIASIMRDSALTTRQWEKKKAVLKAARKIRDPNYKKHFQSPTKAEKDIAKVIDTLSALPLTYSVIGKANVLAYEGDTNFKPAKKGKKKSVLFDSKHLDVATTPVDQLIKTRGGVSRA